MIEVLRAAAEVQEVFLKHRWRYCFIGGIAVLRWGQPRETVDVDATLITGLGDEVKYISELSRIFEPRLSDATEFALKRRVLLLQTSSGVGIDVALGWIPFEEKVVNRSTMYDFPQDIVLRTCSAEDLIVMKAFAQRDKDWFDTENVIIRQGDKLDWDYIYRELTVLADAKNEPEIVMELKKRREKIQQP